MPFGSAMTERAPSEQYTKVESPFIRLTAEVPQLTIRILDNDITTYWRYWLPVNVGDRWDGRPVIVGRNSPIKDYLANVPEGDAKFKNRKPQFRAYINVLDRTVGDKGPLNKVMIWDIGRELVEALQVFDGRQISRRTMEKMRLQDFDIELTRVVRRQADGSERASVVPQPGFNDEPLPEEVLNQPRYDLVKMTQPMPDEAQIRLLNGENYNEVRKSLGWDGNYPMVSPDELPF